MVRGALTNTLSSLSGSTSSEIELQEDAPRVGDLTLIVRIRGNAIRHAESGARERLQRATEMLDRNERAMNILDVYCLYILVYTMSWQLCWKNSFDLDHLPNSGDCF